MMNNSMLVRIFCTAIFVLGVIPVQAEPSKTDNRLDIIVRHTLDRASTHPVTGGVPIPEGAAPNGSQFVLHDTGGKPVPLQAEVLARWKDGSARWVLLDFSPNVQTSLTDKSRFVLTWGSTEGIRPESPSQYINGSSPQLTNGDIALIPIDGGLLRIGNRAEIKLTVTDNEGLKCPAVTESIEVETDGLLRATMLLRGSFRKPGGGQLFGFRMRASVYANCERFLLEPMIVMDSGTGLMQHFREVNLEFVPANTIRDAEISGEPGWKGKPEDSVRLFQSDDRTYRFEGAEGTGTHAPGAAAFHDGKGLFNVALRDFWQQWPKSIEVSGEKLIIGLYPRFKEGDFDHMEPWYKYRHLYEGGSYRLRTGQSRRWQVWCDANDNPDRLAGEINAQPVIAVDPKQALSTRVWGPVAAAGTPGMEEYDAWAENLIVNGYFKSVSEQRDYGETNWGDWFGERQCNWGNHEYDTPKHLLVQFARTGDPRYFYAGERAARHMSEVDVINFVNDDLRNYFEETLGGRNDYPVRPGMVHEHCVGHVSGYYPVDTVRDLYVSFKIGNTPKPYLCLDPYNLGHIWTQGMVYHYFLTGDSWVRDTVNRIGENLRKLAEDRQFQFKGHSHCGRTNGWTMLAIAGAYELDFDERYLKAMKLIADDALSEQDPNCGGWLYTLPWGHCYCKTKHVGEAGFINSVRQNGLAKYYELTGDDRIPEAVSRAVNFLNRDTWVEEWSDWRYTSCPATGPISQIGVTIMALVNSVKLSGDEEQLRILRKAWNAKFARMQKVPANRPGVGKTFSVIMYGSPEAANFFVNGVKDSEEERKRISE